MNKYEKVISDYLINNDMVINSNWNWDNHYEIYEDSKFEALVEDLAEDMAEWYDVDKVEQYLKKGEVFDIAD